MSYPGGSHNCAVDRNMMLQTGKPCTAGSGSFHSSHLLPGRSWWLSYAIQSIFQAKGVAEHVHSHQATT